MTTIEATEIAPIAPARVVRWIDRGQGFQPAYLKKNCGIVFDRYGDVSVLMLGKQQWTVSKSHAFKCSPIERENIHRYINSLLSAGYCDHIAVWS